MLYTAITELKLGLFVIHCVQTVNTADQMQRLGSVRGGERACWNRTVPENVFHLSKDHIPYNQEKTTEKGFMHTLRHSLTSSFCVPDAT